MRDKRDISYAKTFEWVDFDGDTAYIGLDDHAQELMGDLVFINLPEVGDTVEAGESFGDVESVKAVEDIFSPVTGTVAEVNVDVIDNPALINEEPYEAWLIKVENITDKSELLDRKGIEEVIEKEAD